jgi:hypothetical protein
MITLQTAGVACFRGLWDAQTANGPRPRKQAARPMLTIDSKRLYRHEMGAASRAAPAPLGSRGLLLCVTACKGLKFLPAAGRILKANHVAGQDQPTKPIARTPDTGIGSLE